MLLYYKLCYNKRIIIKTNNNNKKKENINRKEFYKTYNYFHICI